MKKMGMLLVAAGLCALDCSAYNDALNAVYQWSVEVPRLAADRPPARAFLWVPERCRRLKGVVLGADNMLEEPIFAHARFRAALAKADIGIVFVIPDLDCRAALGDAEKGQIVRLMDDLAAASGYTELKTVKIAAIGHSAWADFPWLMAAEWPERTLCAMSVKGSWPEANRPIPTQLIPRFRTDIPLLLVDGEFEDGERRGKLAVEFFGQRPELPFSMYVDWGGGHFDWSDRLCAALGRFVAAAARGEDTRALMAKAQPARPAPGQVPVLGYRVNGERVKQNPKSHTQIDLDIPTGGLRESDLRFTMDAVFDPVVPAGRPVGWTGLAAGSAAPHPADDAPITVEVIQGPCVQTGPRAFQLRLNRRGYMSYKGCEIVLQEKFPGGDGFRPCVQQALLRMKKPSQPFGGKHYFIREGAATVDADTGKVTFLPLPPRAKRPATVTVCEWTWGPEPIIERTIRHP